MAHWAVFDVDGTLLPKSSMEQRFLIHLLKRGVIPNKNMLSYFFYGVFMALKGNWEDGFKNNKRYLEGLAADEIKKLAEYFYQHSISPALSQTGLNTLEEYRQRGYKILIMSGSPDFLTEHFVAEIKSDHFIWTTMEAKDGKFTGNIIGPHPYGIRKKQIMEELQPQLEINFKESIVFANHHADVHHMEMFGKAVAVNPTSKLKLIAMERAWKMKIWT